MTQSFGKSMSTSGSNFLQPKGTPNPSVLGGATPATAPQEGSDPRRLFQNIGLPPMAKTMRPSNADDIFAPPDDGKAAQVAFEQVISGQTASGQIAGHLQNAVTQLKFGETQNPAPGLKFSNSAPIMEHSVSTNHSVVATNSTAANELKASPTATTKPLPEQDKPNKSVKEQRYDIPFAQQEKEILSYLSDFTKSPEFKPFQTPRSRRSLTNNEGSTVVEELAQDFSTRMLTMRKDGSSEQIKDRLGRLIYEKFEESGKWTARFLYYHDQGGKKSPFVLALKSLSSDGRFREVQYSKLGQVESEREKFYDLKLANL